MKKANYIELRRDFKQKAGLTRIRMTRCGYNENEIKYVYSYCYPTDNPSDPWPEKFTERRQETYDMTPREANETYARLLRENFKETKRIPA